MAISLITYPPYLALAKNPVVFKLLTNNAIETAGVKANLSLIFNDDPYLLVDGDSFDLVWGSNIITITVKTTPDSSGNQIKAIVQGQTLTQWVLQTHNYLNSNYYISRDFTIASVLNSMIFAARETGDEYTLTLDNEPPTKINSQDAVTGVTEVYREFFSMLCQTFVKDGTEMLKKFEDALSVDSSYNAFVDIAEILKAELYSEFEWPEASATSWKKREHLLLPYFIRYCEQFGNPLTPQKIATTQYFWAFNGGIPFWKQVDYYSAGTSFWDRMLYEMNFLTWQPRTKKIDIYQPETLYWVAWKNTLNNTTCRLKITAHTYDETGLITTTIYSGDQAVSYMDVFELQVGYARLNELYDIDAYFHDQGVDGVTGQYYEVEVVIKSGGLVISEKFTYEVDLTEYPNTRYFRFLNSVGGYDTVRTTGIGEFELAPERAFITSPYPKEFDAAFKQKKNIFISGTQKMKVNTGWKNKEEIDWLQDFMLSEEVYEIIDGKLYPIVITSTSGPKYVDEQSPAYFMEFEYERSTHDTTYATGIQEQEGGDFNEDFNDDYIID